MLDWWHWWATSDSWTFIQYSTYLKIFLNIVSGMPAPWFGPIANNGESNNLIRQRGISTALQWWWTSISPWIKWRGWEILSYWHFSQSPPASRISARNTAWDAVYACSLARNFFLLMTHELKFELGAITLIVSGWVRFAGTALSLSGGRAYALLFIGQVRSSFCSRMPYTHFL